MSSSCTAVGQLWSAFKLTITPIRENKCGDNSDRCTDDVECVLNASHGYRHRFVVHGDLKPGS